MHKAHPYPARAGKWSMRTSWPPCLQVFSEFFIFFSFVGGRVVPSQLCCVDRRGSYASSWPLSPLSLFSRPSAATPRSRLPSAPVARSSAVTFTCSLTHLQREGAFFLLFCQFFFFLFSSAIPVFANHESVAPLRPLVVAQEVAQSTSKKAGMTQNGFWRSLQNCGS